tara:strand:- start:219 stop:377 length:159 start_codon:yes stop_codon:yes gene_type:complete
MPYFTPYFLHGIKNESKEELYIPMEVWIKSPQSMKDTVKELSESIDFSRDED